MINLYKARVQHIFHLSVTCLSVLGKLTSFLNQSMAHRGRFLSSIPHREYNLQEEMHKMQIDLQGDPYFDIPSSWLKKNPHFILPVWNQGPIGACYGFPLTDAASALYVIQGGNPVSLAKQEFIDELHKRYGHSHGSSAEDEQKEEGNEGKKKRRRISQRDEGKKKRRCISATMETAFLMMAEYGVYEEEVYPYRAVKNMSFVTPASAVARGQKFFIFGSIVDKDENLSTMEAEVMEALEHQPIVGTMFAPRSLRKFKGKGIYGGALPDEIAAEKKIYHCVLIVGSGVDKNGEEFFLIKNSWGEDWGYKGFAKVRRNLILEYGFPIGPSGFKKVNRMGKQSP